MNGTWGGEAHVLLSQGAGLTRENTEPPAEYLMCLSIVTVSALTLSSLRTDTPKQIPCM